MAGLEKRSFAKPDECLSPPRSRMETLRFGDSTLSRNTFEPGWRWSVYLKPIVGTESCQKHHIGYCLSGTMAARLDDGTKVEFGPGDVVDIPPGHDGWVVGNEPCVLLEFGCAHCNGKP
jgi:hypothetical protein